MVVNFFEALAKLLAYAINFFNDIFHTRLFSVYDTIIASIFQAMGYQVTHDSPISGISLPPEDQKPGFIAASLSRGMRESWKNISSVASEGASKLIDSSVEVVNEVKDSFMNFVSPLTEGLIESMVPGSPPDEKMKKFSEDVTKGFLGALDKIKPKAKSKITYEQARNAAASYLTGNIAMNLFSRTFATALDATHPIKKWGVDKIVDGIWWGLGLNWLTWVALGPFMQSYIAKPLARQFRMEFSESDLTPSDILKLYKIGYFSREKTIEKLHYHGYDEEDTEAKLALISQEESETEKQLSVTTILKALKLGYISEENAIQRLTDKGYLDSDIELWIKVTLHEKDDEGRSLTRAQILRFYSEEILTLEETRQALSDMKYTELQITNMIELEDLKRYPTRKYLTHAQVLNYLKKKWMSQEEAAANWYNMGYTDYEIYYFMKEAE